MNLSLIVAHSDDHAIGRRGDLPWHLGSDLRRFKRLTMGHHLILGRKTYESIGRALPGRQMIVVSRNADFSATHGWVANSLEAAVALADNDSQPFVIGGGEIYRVSLPFVQTLYRTRVHTSIPDADAFFPNVDEEQWERVESEFLQAGANDDFDSLFEVLRRRHA